jgi:hypothetical protein
MTSLRLGVFPLFIAIGPVAGQFADCADGAW